MNLWLLTRIGRFFLSRSTRHQKNGKLFRIVSLELSPFSGIALWKNSGREASVTSFTCLEGSSYLINTSILHYVFYYDTRAILLSIDPFISWLSFLHLVYVHLN